MRSSIEFSFGVKWEYTQMDSTSIPDHRGYITSQNITGSRNSRASQLVSSYPHELGSLPYW